MGRGFGEGGRVREAPSVGLGERGEALPAARGDLFGRDIDREEGLRVVLVGRDEARHELGDARMSGERGMLGARKFDPAP